MCNVLTPVFQAKKGMHMARLIGTVRQVVGEVFAVAGDGSKRALVAGDKVYVGEHLQTGATGAVAVHLAAGGELTLGRGSSLPLTPEILANHATHVDAPDVVAPTQSQLTEVAQLQQAIAAGADPTQLTDPPAAGPANPNGAPTALGGGHSVVLLTEVAGVVNPVVGFPTAGFNTVPEFPENWLADTRDSSPSAPVGVIPPVIVPPLEPPIEPPVVVPPVEPPVEPPVVVPPVEPPVEPPVVVPPVEPPVNHLVTLTDSSVTLNEANLVHGSDSNPSALTQNGTFIVSAPDGLKTLNVGGIDVIKDGLVIDAPPSILTPLGNTLTVTGYNPQTGEVSYSVTLNGSLSHPDGDGANRVSEQIGVTAVDRDGDAASATLQINVVDDVPHACDVHVAVVNEPVNSNLLLIVDNSASMNDPSGVDGLSRLELAKQAISELLDKYEAMGDVKVQIVTFNSAPDILGDGWVDVATAKSIINSLGAGNGTNYDSALTAAETAFLKAGSQAGAQNLAYFFSDGNPTLSNEHSNPNHQPNPAQGDGIDATEEAAWISFLESHGINAFAIGLGTDVSNTYLDPIAYNGIAGVNTNAVIVTDLGELSAVLTGTVQGGTSGSLLAGGTFGADGGFIKSITVDGSTYTYDPKANDNKGGISVSGADHSTFDTATNSVTVTSSHGGTLVVDMDSGAFSYTPSTQGGAAVTEKISFVLSDNDGDLSGATLQIKVPGAITVHDAPVAVDDHIITNVLSSSITVPAAALLVNDHSPGGDSLSATPTTFNTGWAAKGADFSASALKTINFSGTQNKDVNQLKNLDRSDLFSNSALTALVVLNGYLGSVDGAPQNSQDLYSINLKAGETVTVQHNLTDAQLGMAWQMDNGQFQALADGGTFTATEDNVYRLVVTNQADPGGDSSQHYKLSLLVDYSATADSTPDYQGSYTIHDSHGGSDTAAVSISYQPGETLLGTTGDDVLIGGPGHNSIHGGDGNDVLVAGSSGDDLYGDNGNDLLISGPGNDVLDGGAGNNTASYAMATSGVTVSTAIITQQDTHGAGLDTLINIQNLIGSSYDDHLTGDSGDNVINGGAGNDVIRGGGGNDILTGGSGNDTFQWLAGDTGHTLVTDFTFGADKLDLSQLLQGAHDTAGSLDDYLHFSVSGSGNSLVSTISVSSTANAGPTQTIELAGIDLAAHYGVAPGAGGVVAGGHDTASIITGMLSDHSLKVDTV